MSQFKEFIKKTIIAIVPIFLLVLLDQYTKQLAISHLRNQKPFPIIEGIFQLLYLENRGAAFGMMQNKQIFFIVGAILILCACAYFWHKMPWTKKYLPLRIVCILICSGAIGNFIDRITRHYVVDFFYFELIDFPIFNVADIYVTIACVCFLLLMFFYYKEDDLTFYQKKTQ